MNAPTVTIPLSQFNLLKRALRLAWTYRMHQLESDDDTSTSTVKNQQWQLEYDMFRKLEGDLEEAYA